MSNQKRHSKLKKKLIIKFLFFTLFISSFPVIGIYLNYANYLTTVSDFLKKTSLQLTQITNGAVPIEESEISLEVLQKTFEQSVVSANKAIQEINSENAILIGLSVLFIFMVSQLIIIKVRYQFKVLEEGIRETHYGNFSYRIKSDRKDEIGQVINQFNEMSIILDKKADIARKAISMSEAKHWSNELGITELKAEEVVIVEDEEINIDRVHYKKMKSHFEEFLHQENEISQILQQSFFNQEIPKLPELKISAKFSSEGKGGHFLFHSISKEKLGFIIFEIMEEGVTSLFLSNYILILSKQEFQKHSNIEDFCNAMNQKIHPFVQKFDLTVTAFSGIINLNTLKLSFVNSGFKPPIYFANKGIQTISPNGHLNLGKDYNYTQNTYQIDRGDKLFFCNRHLSLEAQGGRFSFKIGTSDLGMKEEVSFDALSDKLIEILDKEVIKETTLLIEFKENNSGSKGSFKELLDVKC